MRKQKCLCFMKNEVRKASRLPSSSSKAEYIKNTDRAENLLPKSKQPPKDLIRIVPFMKFNETDERSPTPKRKGEMTRGMSE